MKKVGAYLPGAYEEVVDVVDAYVLTEKVRVMGGSTEGEEECFTECLLSTLRQNCHCSGNTGTGEAQELWGHSTCSATRAAYDSIFSNIIHYVMD